MAARRLSIVDVEVIDLLPGAEVLKNAELARKIVSI
jgi:hypothetical protein